MRQDANAIVKSAAGTMRVASSIFLLEPKHIPVCWKLQSKRVLSIVTGLDRPGSKPERGLSKRTCRR
jgi:hypothetical protein